MAEQDCCEPVYHPSWPRPKSSLVPSTGGCYIAAENVCKIHIDPFTININDGAGAKLQLFTLQANDQPLYDFRTDISNPPSNTYVPSLVALDFGAQCGVTYTLTLLAEDTATSGFVTVGSTNEFMCPLLETPTLTPTPTATLIPISTSTPTATPAATLASTPTATPQSAFLPSLRR